MIARRLISVAVGVLLVVLLVCADRYGTSKLTERGRNECKIGHPLTVTTVRGSAAGRRSGC